MTEAEMVKRLNSFSKAQIINAIVKTYWYKGSVERLISNLEYIEKDEILKKHKEVIKEESEITKQYIKWRGDMIEKYGTEGTLKWIDIPHDELMKGANLESRMKAIREKESRISGKINSLFEM